MGLHNHNASDICLLHRVKTWTLSKKKKSQNLDLSILKGTCSSDLGAHKS